MYRIIYFKRNKNILRENFQHHFTQLQYTKYTLNIIIILTGEDDNSQDRFPAIQEIVLIVGYWHWTMMLDIFLSCKKPSPCPEHISIQLANAESANAESANAESSNAESSNAESSNAEYHPMPNHLMPNIIQCRII